MRDPVILIDYANELSIPITCKPLPALLAPPSPLNHHGSLSSFVSSVSSSSNMTATQHQQHDSTEELAYLQQPTNSSYYNVIQKQSQEIQDLRQDLIKLNQKYIDQIDRIQIAEQAQFQVESELEDLSSKLFEQANEMVAQERKARFLAEKRVAQLERELSGVYEALDNEREQLKELRIKFAAVASESQSTLLTSESANSTTVTTIENNNNQEQLLHPFALNKDSNIGAAHLSFTPPHFNADNIQLDDGWLTLFKDFLTVAPDTPIESMHRLPFLKQCLELDIAPCLRFGNNVKWGKLSIKKVLETVIKEPCFIESYDNLEKRHSHDDRITTTEKQQQQQQQQQAIVRRSSFAIFRSALMTTVTATKQETYACHGCGNTTSTRTHLFRFKLKESDPEWCWIDRSCRDRLVAVCNFYVFIRHVRQGLQSQRTIKSLFQECVWLRLVMFWARSGLHHLTLN